MPQSDDHPGPSHRPPTPATYPQRRRAGGCRERYAEQELPQERDRLDVRDDTIAARLAGVDTRRVEYLLDLVGIADAAGKRVGTYSLGMRQRLGVAQALIGEPAALILDEPANGLDPEGIAWMRTLLRDFADRGGTVLLSSHLLHEVQATADHLVVIADGAVVAAGRLDELLAASTILVRSPDPHALSPARMMCSPWMSPVVGSRQRWWRSPATTRCCSPSCVGPRQTGWSQLFFSLTAAKAAPAQEAAA